MAKEN